MINSDGKKCRTTNYFEICWLKLCEDFGESVFADYMENMVAFIYERIAKAKDLFLPLCRPLCPTDKPISSKDDILNKQINDFLENEVSRKEASVRTYFNPTIRICPDDFSKKAEQYLETKYIDDIFVGFREYWLSQGQKLFAKKVDWLETWEEQLKEVISNPRTRYKMVKPQEARRISWTLDLTTKSDWKARADAQYNAFTEWYSINVPGLLGTKDQWQARWNRWDLKNVFGKPDETKVEPKFIDVKLPDDSREIHENLLKEVGRGLYVSWIQNEVDFVSDDTNGYHMRFKSDFKRDRVKRNPIMMDVLKMLNISIIN